MLINKPEEDDGITGQFNHSTHLCRTHPAAATSSNASPRAPRQIFEAWHFTLYQAQDPGDDQGRILQQPLHWVLSTSNQFTRNRPGSPLREPSIGYSLSSKGGARFRRRRQSRPFRFRALCALSPGSTILLPPHLKLAVSASLASIHVSSFGVTATLNFLFSTFPPILSGQYI
jgi:hypothetical protein